MSIEGIGIAGKGTPCSLLVLNSELKWPARLWKADLLHRSEGASISWTEQPIL